jgi:hypothetical protein
MLSLGTTTTFAPDPRPLDRTYARTHARLVGLSD